MARPRPGRPDVPRPQGWPSADLAGSPTGTWQACCTCCTVLPSVTASCTTARACGTPIASSSAAANPLPRRVLQDAAHRPPRLLAHQRLPVTLAHDVALIRRQPRDPRVQPRVGVDDSFFDL